MIYIFWEKFKTVEIVYYEWSFCYLRNSHFKNQTKWREIFLIQPSSVLQNVDFDAQKYQHGQSHLFHTILYPYRAQYKIRTPKTISNIWFMTNQAKQHQETLYTGILHNIFFQNLLQTILYLGLNIFMVLYSELSFVIVLKLSCLSVRKYLMTGNLRIS